MKVLRYLLLMAVAAGCASPSDPEPFGPVPTPEQLAWHKSEMNMFAHFGPNTYSGLEWGQGTESNNLFAPDSLDCNQWAAVAREIGFGGIIITAKHHDGFSLWPNPSGTHSVAYSSWRDGKGDVLAELSQACASAGIGFGVYLSPWDRNHPDYGTDAYNQAYAASLESVVSSYGPMFEVWFDGACGEGPTGRKQVYDWPLFMSKVREHQGNVVTFSNVGPGCRWVGNEEGRAGETNWATFTPEAHGAGRSDLPQDYGAYLAAGDEGGACWIPAEVDVSIRPGWFWRESEDSKVKTPEELYKIYLQSVGRGSVLLLNVPPTSHGLLHKNDVASLKGFRALLDKAFADNLVRGASSNGDFSSSHKASRAADGSFDTYWAAPAAKVSEQGRDVPELTVELRDGARGFDTIVLQENIAIGQRVAEFTVEADTPEGWKEITHGTTVGYKRILSVSKTEAGRIRVRFTRTLAPPVISEVGVYLTEL